MPSEVVTLGEAMVRLSPPSFARLEQSRLLDMMVGGAELNTAMALACLGHRSAWVSRLTRNPLGRLVENHARSAGVDTSHLVWTDEDRVGLYFVEFGAAPRPSAVYYDRKGSAAAGLTAEMVPWREVLQGARWFHVTGITPALGPAVAEATRVAVQTARELGVTVSIDLNYRAKLWSREEARRCLPTLVALADVLIASEPDADQILGIREANVEETAARLAAKYELRTVAFTARESSLAWRNHWWALAWSETEKKIYRTDRWEVEIVDRLGAGDAFAAGLIHGLLEGDLQKGLNFGIVAGSLKHSIPGDAAWITREEIEAVLGDGGMRIRR